VIVRSGGGAPGKVTGVVATAERARLRQDMMFARAPQVWVTSLWRTTRSELAFHHTSTLFTARTQKNAARPRPAAASLGGRG
jgi:hypothetical protein